MPEATSRAFRRPRFSGVSIPQQESEFDALSEKVIFFQVIDRFSMILRKLIARNHSK